MKKRTLNDSLQLKNYFNIKIIKKNKSNGTLKTIRTSNLIETNFQKISPNDTLGNLVEIISKTTRNIFPVIDSENKLLGIIILDNIRVIIFKNDMYDKVTAKELMTNPPTTISPMQTMETVMKIFDETGAWNLPVIDNGKYVGFLSKSSVFTSYRTKLIATTIS